jgi:hypothetical protein
MGKTLFYENIISNPNDTDYSYVINAIKHDDENCGFYELCNKFIDIALNADKWRDKETNELKFSARINDVDIAKEATLKFVSTYGIKNTKALLEMVNGRYQESISEDEIRQTSGLIRNKENQFTALGHFGTYYILTQIPIWDVIEKEIIEFADSEIDKQLGRRTK